MKKLNRLFYTEPHYSGAWMVFSTNYTLQIFNFWVFKVRYIQHNGFDVALVDTKELADKKVKILRKGYFEACKIVKR